VNDRDLATRKAIEKGRLADVWPADDGDVTHLDCRDAAAG
jgi:hypothetical protein